MQELAQPLVHLGTSSWLFDGWRGTFYPDRVPKNQYLPFYASHFDTVEVNTSFYAIPSPSVLVNWVESVPAGFTYALKFPRAITHDRRLVDCTDLTRTFLDALRALGPAAGPAFLQLPPDFTRRGNGRDLAGYLDWLAPEAPDLRLAVEARSADLLTAGFARFVAERNFALVLVDRMATADLYATWVECVDAGLGPDFSLIRWIGDDRSGPQGDRELQAPRNNDLERWAQRIAELTQRGRTVFGYMHNPYEGHSPASARRLRTLLDGRVRLPDWPPAGMAGQLSLF